MARRSGRFELGGRASLTAWAGAGRRQLQRRDDGAAFHPRLEAHTAIAEALDKLPWP